MFVFICACALHVVLCVCLCGSCVYEMEQFLIPTLLPTPERLSGNKQVMALVFLEGPFSGGVLPLPQLPAYFT